MIGNRNVAAVLPTSLFGVAAGMLHGVPAGVTAERRAVGWRAWTARPILALLFILIALPTGALLAMLTPPGQVADEPAHVLRAGSLLHGQLIGRRTLFTMPDGIERLMGGVDADAALLSVMEGPGWPKLDRARIKRLRAICWQGTRQFYQVPNVAIYMPVFYVPSALGMAAAKLLGAGPYDAVQTGRLVNVLCVVLAGAAALLLARRGHALLFCTMTFPMTLSLAASFNQDGLLIVSCALAAALLTRTESRRSYWTAAAILGCVVAVKLPYAPLLAALLLPLPPPREWLRRDGLLRRVGIALLVALPGVLWTWYALRNVSSPFMWPPYEAGPLWPGARPAPFDSTNPLAQLSVLLAEPLRALTVPWNTLSHDKGMLLSAVGVLGWLNLRLPEGMYTAWGFAVAAAVLCDLLAPKPREASGRLGDMALMLLASALCVLGIYLSQYLTWTPVGKASVDGPSGRYLLPILPFLAIGLPQLALPFSTALRAACLVLPVAAAAIGVVVLPLVIVAEFYLR